MARQSTFPTLFDKCKTLSVSDLKRFGFLKPDRYCSGVIRWKLNEEQTGSISNTVNTQAEVRYIELNYSYNKTPICYTIQLVSISSNLCKGNIWLFLCPRTGVRCRKLHFVGAYLYHRTAFRGLYQKQTYSQKNRELDKLFAELFGA